MFKYRHQIEAVRETKSRLKLQYNLVCVLEVLFLLLMQTGIIKKLMTQGFGFIQPEGSEKDLFFHATEVADGGFNDLKEGDKVNFEMGEGPKGPNAIKVSRA